MKTIPIGRRLILQNQRITNPTEMIMILPTVKRMIRSEMLIAQAILIQQIIQVLQMI